MGARSMIRTRWAAVGAALAVSVGAGGVGLLHATSPDGAAAFVPITPCRLFDTRADSQVGGRGAALQPGETFTLAATGAQGNCNLPGEATGVVLNVTAVGATLPTFLTIWPAGEPQPTASALNPAPGTPPAPNAVTTDFGNGAFSVFNKQGTVDVLGDVVGYYTDHSHDDRYYPRTDTYSRAEVEALVATSSVGSYLVETNVGASPTVMTQIGPLTYRLSCVANAGSTEYTVEITSDVGPWYVDDVEHPAGFVYEATAGATPDGDPAYNYWFASVFVPSAGIVVADDGYRNVVFTEYPGADCRAAGSILPIVAE